MILTYGEQLYTGNKDTHTSLVKKLDQERANDFGKLLIEKMKMKVIAVNNREESFYFKEQLRKQVVRLVAANVTKPYTNISFEQVIIRNTGRVSLREIYSPWASFLTSPVISQRTRSVR